ncbi:MAG: hypothetical protein HC843_09465 [Sphingomonadales bacterium]|nr:hypothetical protein [Sphingomonadales bacterium]
MSWEAQAWAAKQKTGSSAAKLVLLGLASCADANHCAFPSIAWLSEFGDLDRKTVISALQRLERGMFPLIEDTGERKGRTKQVKVYRLASATVENATADPASLTVPKTERSQKRNSSVSSGKQSRKRDTEPFYEPNPPFHLKMKRPPLIEKRVRRRRGLGFPTTGNRQRLTICPLLPSSWFANGLQGHIKPSAKHSGFTIRRKRGRLAFGTAGTTSCRSG